MKKLLLFFIGATLISCGGKDDDEAGRTTDPLIGTWYREFDDTANATIVYNSNGTWTGNVEEEGETNTITGGWNNNGSDFDAVRQIYTFTYDDDTDDLTFTLEFNPDFSSFTIGDDETWSRQ